MNKSQEDTVRESRVVALCVSARRGIAKSPVARVVFVADHGIEGDAHAGPGERQVSLLAAESSDKMRAKGLSLEHGAFGENIVTSGLNLLALAPGDRLRAGAVELEITRIGKECHSRCAIYYSAGDCVMPREGVFARVLAGGELVPGQRLERLPAIR